VIKFPKVTVYITVYNYGRFVEKAIESVFRQTLKDWELLVINDGSTDDTETILKKYESNDKVTVVNQKNKGLTVSCNIALRLAKGDYIMRLDGDDHLEENALLVLSHYLDEHPDIGLAYPDYYVMDENDDVISIERRDKIGKEEDVLLDMPAHGACTMFRREILLEMGGYNEEIFCQDGYDIWLRFIEKYKVGNVNLPLFYYRQHKTSMTKDDKKILDTRHKIKRKYAELKRSANNKSELKRIAIIPARSHSNVTVRMALEECAGKPLINYTLDEALAAECFDKIVLVSEDDEIIEYTKKHYPNVVLVKRPAKYARRNTGLEKTVKLVLDTMKERINEEYEEGVLLFVESPLKRAEHIQKAVDTMHIFDVDSVVPLCETYNPYYVRGKKGLERLGTNEKFRLERKIVYRGNGALMAFKTENIKSGAITGRKIGHIIMLEEDSVNIASAFDYKLVQFLLRERNVEKNKNTDKYPGDVGISGVDSTRL